MEREVHAVLGPVGVDEKLSRRVAQNLLALEMENTSENGINGSASGGDTESNGLRWSKDVGVTAFLLRFGEGMGEFVSFWSATRMSCVSGTERIILPRRFQRKYPRDVFTSQR